MVAPWTSTVTRYFAGEIPPENPLWNKFFSPGPNSGRLHCRIIATPLNRNPSAEEDDFNFVFECSMILHPFDS